MFRCGATTKSTMHYLVAVVWLAAFHLLPCAAYGDTISMQAQKAYKQTINKQINNDIHCTNLSPDNSLCSIRTELRYHHYLNTPMTLHERFSSTPIETDQPRADLLAVFKLALEEFDILPGVRIYYEYTERNIEQWAIKLRLKGEISFSDPNFHANGQSATNTSRGKRKVFGSSLNTSDKLRFIKPQKINWNIGLNPNDMTVYGDLRINPYLSISGEVGDESHVGIYFSYAF